MSTIVPGDVNTETIMAMARSAVDIDVSTCTIVDQSLIGWQEERRYDVISRRGTGYWITQ